MVLGSADGPRNARPRRRPRNAEMLIWVNGDLLPRERATVSVFDSGFVLGDGVWEGLRVHRGHPAFLDQHLDRLFGGATGADDRHRPDPRAAEGRAIYDTLRANEMVDGVHIRLMVTRGVKRTPYQDPRLTIGPATVVIVAEHKEALPAIVADSITLFTTHVRRATPDTLDPKLNAHSKLNDIAACIQAYSAGADEALMLDPHGFVATCNSTHFFIVPRPGRCGPATAGSASVASPGAPCSRSAAPTASPPTSPRSASPRSTAPRKRSSPAPSPASYRSGRSTAARSVRSARSVGRAAAGPLPGARGRRRGRAMTVRVAMWSGPRNISTAMMRAWENRPDTVVVDEPFYASYLLRTGLDHPGREAVVSSQPTDPAEVVRGLRAPVDADVHYAKQMTHHLADDAELTWGPVPQRAAGARPGRGGRLLRPLPRGLRAGRHRAAPAAAAGRAPDQSHPRQ